MRRWVVLRFMGVTTLRPKEHWGMPLYVIAEFDADARQAQSVLEFLR